MILLSPRSCRRVAPQLWCFFLTGLAFLSAPAAFAQSDVHYTRHTTFRIPFSIDATDRRVQQVLLHVSEDQGRSYVQVASAAPQEKGFQFTARREGGYWFSVQTVDQDGHYSPPKVENVPPALKVCVDTIAPSVLLRPATPRDGGTVAVEWDVRDENLDLESLRLEYRLPGRDWQALNVQHAMAGQRSFDPGTNSNVEVRLVVKDRAGNQGQESTTVNPVSSRSIGNESPRPDPGRNNYPPPDPVRDNIRKVKSKIISLNYQIKDAGPSGVATVEVWWTRDTKIWNVHQQPATSTGPYVITVDSEGLYGFTLVPKSGVGLGERPPSAGDQPQIWVEVDTTVPVVHVTSVEVGRGVDTGKLTIYWTASDKNLAKQPITISYAAKPEGPWTPIPGATKIENMPGRFVWPMQEGVPYMFHVRVAAEDEAGNIGFADTPQPVKVDLAIPKVHSLNVEPAKQP